MRKAIIIMVVLVLLSCKRDEPGSLLDIRSINTGNSGLLSDVVSSQLHEDNVRSWYGTDMGLSKLQDSGWAEYSMGTFMLNNDKVSSLGLYSNQILIGTRGGGVNRLVVEGLDAVSGASPYDTVWTGLPSGHINCILVDAGDGKWFGTPLGLSLHEGDGTKEGGGKAKSKTIPVKLDKHLDDNFELSKHFVDIVLNGKEAVMPLSLEAKHLRILFEVYKASI